MKELQVNFVLVLSRSRQYPYQWTRALTNHFDDGHRFAEPALFRTAPPSRRHLFRADRFRWAVCP